MCAVVGDITSSVARVAEYVVPGVAVKYLVMRLDLGQPRVALGEGLKGINGERCWATFVGSFVATQLLMNKVYGPKNAFSEFWT